MIKIRPRNISYFKGMEPWRGRLNKKKIELRYVLIKDGDRLYKGLLRIDMVIVNE